MLQLRAEQGRAGRRAQALLTSRRRRGNRPRRLGTARSVAGRQKVTPQAFGVVSTRLGCPPRLPAARYLQPRGLRLFTVVVRRWVGVECGAPACRMRF